jgi:hypothetical protein
MAIDAHGNFHAFIYYNAGKSGIFRTSDLGQCWEWIDYVSPVDPWSHLRFDALW